MKKPFIILILGLTLGMLALTGCNCSVATTTVSPTETATPVETATPTETAAPAEVPPAHGTLRLAGVDPYTLDPGLAAEMTSHTYITQIFGGLVRLDEDLRVVPDIAERWEISPDGTTYTFYLRRDVNFHDGRPVNTADVVYSWERACTPATGSSVAATYLGDIVGVKDMLAGRVTSISGVRTPDDYTIEVTIDAPKSYFLSKLTYPTTYVLDEENVAEGEDWWRHPNGTGPFRLVEWEQGETLVMERNETYHGRVASLERVEYHLWSGMPMNMYETDEIDVTGVSVFYIDRVQDPAGPFYGQLQVTPELSFSFFGFNTTTAPFDDVHVRRAFTYALDKEKIVSIMYRDLVESAGGILPPGIPGYNENLAGLEFNVERAREELALSRYGGASALPPITMTTAGYGGNIGLNIEAAIVQWRENLGAEVTVRQLEPERYFYNLTEEKDEMFEMGWIADYPHPQDFLDILFRTGQENNFAEYSNPALDALLDEAAITGDAAGIELYRRAEEILVEDAACLPLWFGQNYILVKARVQGYKLNAMGLAMLNLVSISD